MKMQSQRVIVTVTKSNMILNAHCVCTYDCHATLYMIINVVTFFKIKFTDIAASYGVTPWKGTSYSWVKVLQ